MDFSVPNLKWAMEVIFYYFYCVLFLELCVIYSYTKE